MNAGKIFSFSLRNFIGKFTGKYKFDYLGYEVIVDSIRIDEVLNSNVTKEMQRFLKYLIEKYEQQINLVRRKLSSIRQLFLL